LTQFVSPDDGHDVLETCRELINELKIIVRHVGHLPRIVINIVFFNILDLTEDGKVVPA
jgi:hypothetical protein